MIKPDNPLLPMLEFGDVINAQKYIEKNGKTKKCKKNLIGKDI